MPDSLAGGDRTEVVETEFAGRDPRESPVGAFRNAPHREMRRIGKRPRRGIVTLFCETLHAVAGACPGIL